VKQASSTRQVSKPRLPAMRTVASTELLVITFYSLRRIRSNSRKVVENP